ncbi:hypothetical protein [Vallitalea guaymasensis]|uniref:hypothetical protein n=1 Tax=Vallitalea guaymasensis TaxID=1185412 RepID=UPI0023523C79|nr:hypothetical protein [Vallitalea guaymasensis]
MNFLTNFLKDNYEWLFSGVLSGLIFFLLGNKKGYDRAIKQNQKIGNNSKGIQVGGNITK